jgi:hypothetical protein
METNLAWFEDKHFKRYTILQFIVIGKPKNYNFIRYNYILKKTIVNNSNHILYPSYKNCRFSIWKEGEYYIVARLNENFHFKIPINVNGNHHTITNMMKYYFKRRGKYIKPPKTNDGNEFRS